MLFKVQNTSLYILIPFYSIAVITNWNALGTKKITYMGEQDKIWIVVPVSEWREWTHYSHTTVTVSTGQSYHVSGFQKPKLMSKSKRVDRAFSFRPLTLGCWPPSLYLRVLFRAPDLGISLFSISIWMSLATSKLHKPKSPFVLSSSIPKLGPSHIVSSHRDWHHLHEAEIYNHSLLSHISPLPWLSLIFLILLTCHCHYFTVKSPSLIWMIVVV